jgi:hypothetical protein
MNSSFRKYGGLNYASSNNIVRNHYCNNDNLIISEKIGLLNSKILNESHIDMSGNSILGVKEIYFYNGSVFNGTSGGDLLSSNNTFTGSNTFTQNVTCNSSISATSFNTTSDYRIKENVTELNESYSVENLRPVEYENKITNKQSIGFIAHEVQEQYPFLVTGEKDGKENQSINYQEIIPILVKEIQDLKKRVTILEN